jgi:8-hydroxy-5-deazaflavin:NADPH oxidoreductase
VTITIIGSGHIGSALAARFAAIKMPVGIVNTETPDEDRALALSADVVILAVPFDAVADATRGTVWTNRIVVDATNPRTVADIRGSSSTRDVSEYVPGAKVVKAFNTLPAAVLADEPAQHAGRRVIFVSSDDAAAASTVTDIISQLGFAPIDLGTPDDGGLLQQRGGPLFLARLLLEESV